MVGRALHDSVGSNDVESVTSGSSPLSAPRTAGGAFGGPPPWRRSPHSEGTLRRIAFARPARLPPVYSQSGVRLPAGRRFDFVVLRTQPGVLSLFGLVYELSTS